MAVKSKFKSMNDENENELKPFELRINYKLKNKYVLSIETLMHFY